MVHDLCARIHGIFLKVIINEVKLVLHVGGAGSSLKCCTSGRQQTFPLAGLVLQLRVCTIVSRDELVCHHLPTRRKSNHYQSITVKGALIFSSPLSAINAVGVPILSPVLPTTAGDETSIKIMKAGHLHQI